MPPTTARRAGKDRMIDWYALRVKALRKSIRLEIAGCCFESSRMFTVYMYIRERMKRGK